MRVCVCVAGRVLEKLMIVVFTGRQEEEKEENQVKCNLKMILRILLLFVCIALFRQITVLFQTCLNLLFYIAPISANHL